MNISPPNFDPDGDGAPAPPHKEAQQAHISSTFESRSSKKPKFGGEYNTYPIPMSFRDKILGGLDYSLFDVDDEIEILEEVVVVTKEGATEKVEVSDRMEHQLSDQWKDMIVLKRMRKSITLQTLCHWLPDLWQIKDCIAIMDQDNMFDAATSMMKATIVWAKLPGLPVHYYNNVFCRRIGKALGRVVHIDGQTAARTRGLFARLAVEVELDKPLVSRIDFRGEIQRVEYENMPLCMHSAIGPKSQTNTAPVNNTDINKVVQTSRFDALQGLHEEEEGPQLTSVADMGKVADKSEKKRKYRPTIVGVEN
ncbi:OLC1v1025839C1 [Oldenlandia corymbosa var. corymbosa]|uniref:OLC1v1025839C1 n=1 Tax=Oldenlandia corymbosa var. corymbosa TaxID=529605 RepID=A0AAV1C8I3_OLDCO|nr:OLC1v1025839C1 [Oldenlandia corymbosa var. corymbosa]